MKVSKAGKIWIDYHHIHSKKNTVRYHKFVKDRFCRQFGDYIWLGLAMCLAWTGHALKTSSGLFIIPVVYAIP
jgi:hypothetical protein